MTNEIVSLQFNIKQLTVQINNMEKRLEQKRKTKLYPEEEEDLLDSINEKKKEVAKLEADIRKIENESVRGSNMADKFGFE